MKLTNQVNLRSNASEAYHSFRIVVLLIVSLFGLNSIGQTLVVYKSDDSTAKYSFNKGEIVKITLKNGEKLEGLLNFDSSNNVIVGERAIMLADISKVRIKASNSKGTQLGAIGFFLGLFSLASDSHSADDEYFKERTGLSYNGLGLAISVSSLYHIFQSSQRSIKTNSKRSGYFLGIK